MERVDTVTFGNAYRRHPFTKLTFGFNSILILEWLSPADRKTGSELHNWIERNRPAAPVNIARVQSRTEFFTALDRLAIRAESSGARPLLHIEAHGDEALGDGGYYGPDGVGGEEKIAWADLGKPLERINIACGCNLLLVSATCWGHAAIFAALHSRRLPFAACLGFSTSVNEKSVLDAMKELYRRALDNPQQFVDIVESMRLELRDGERLDWSSMPVLMYEAFIDGAEKYNTDDEKRTRALNVAATAVRKGVAIDQLPYSSARFILETEQALALQRQWDERLMLDIFPERRESCGFDAAGYLRAHLDRKSGVHLTQRQIDLLERRVL